MASGENGSATADPFAGERLRPCAREPPSSSFAAVLEPARAPRRPGGGQRPLFCAAPRRGAARVRPAQRRRRRRTDQVGLAAPFPLGLRFVTFRSEIDFYDFFNSS